MRRARVRSQGPEEPITDIRRRAPLVLVVEDAADVREMYADYFGLSGFRTAVAVDGVEAVEKSVTLHPDVVIMDLALPRLDGWEATRRIREHVADVPIVAVSGYTSEAHVSAAREAGCDDFIAKPALPQQVLARVRTLLRCALRLRGRRHGVFVFFFDDRDLRDRELVGDWRAVGEVPFRGRRFHGRRQEHGARRRGGSQPLPTHPSGSMPAGIVAPRHDESIAVAVLRATKRTNRVISGSKQPWHLACSRARGVLITRLWLPRRDATGAELAGKFAYTIRCSCGHAATAFVDVEAALGIGSPANVEWEGDVLRLSGPLCDDARRRAAERFKRYAMHHGCDVCRNGIEE